MSPKPKSATRLFADLPLHGAHKRAPDGRKLTREERDGLALVDEINAEVHSRAEAAAGQARSRDIEWLLGQFLDPVSLASRKTPKLPETGLLMRAIARIEDAHAGRPPSDPRAREMPRRKLAQAVEEWIEAVAARRRDPRWKHVQGAPVTLSQFHAWQEHMASIPLTVIPNLDVVPEFERALDMVEEWDELLFRRGHVGERFSLREEVVRLHNWPGDQWQDGDDYASAQNRFHRRLRKARKLAEDPVRDRVMERALYLREGLLLEPVDALEWFLAVCRFRWAAPQVLDVRPELGTWRLVEWVARMGRPAPVGMGEDVPEYVTRAGDPREVPLGLLTAVSGPQIMIDLDEDVVTALPPGCKVRRLVLSARGPLGPDWTVYWVESEWGDARPILDLVESAKLHPTVVFVSDGEPGDLAALVRPFLPRAFKIPTHALSAHSHHPGVRPREWMFGGVPGPRPDAAL